MDGIGPFILGAICPDNLLYAAIYGNNIYMASMSTTAGLTSLGKFASTDMTLHCRKNNITEFNSFLYSILSVSSTKFTLFGVSANGQVTNRFQMDPPQITTIYPSCFIYPDGKTFALFGDNGVSYFSYDKAAVTFLRTRATGTLI